MKKVCSWCKTEKDVLEFHKKKSTRDGLNCYCKPCNIALAVSWKRKNPEKKLETDRRWNKNNHEKLIQKRRAWEKTNREKINGYRKVFKIKNPLVFKAYCKVHTKLRDKKISIQPCSVCGETKNIHAHHEDYSKPLEITWLCFQHHVDRHKTINKHLEGVALC